VSSEVTTRFTTARKQSEHRQEETTQQQQAEPQAEEEPEEVFDILDWIDDNLNFVFAGAVSLGMLYICMTVIGGALSAEGRTEKQSSHLQGKVKSEKVEKEEKKEDSAKTK